MPNRALINGFAPARRAQCSRHERIIRALDFPPLHLFRNTAIGFAPAREHQNARDISLETLVHAEIPCGFSFNCKIFGQTTDDIVAAFRRVCRKKRGFVNGYDIRILMQNAAGWKCRPKRFEGHGFQFCVMFVPAGAVNVNSAGSILSGWVAPSRSKRLRLPCASTMRMRRITPGSFFSSKPLST